MYKETLMKRISTWSALRKAPWVCPVLEEIGENRFNFIPDGAEEKTVREKVGENNFKVKGKGLSLIKTKVSIPYMPDPKIVGKSGLKPCVMVKIPLNGDPTYIKMSHEELIYFDKDQRKQIIEMIKRNKEKHKKANIINWAIVGIVTSYVIISIVTAVAFAIINQSMNLRMDQIAQALGIPIG